MTEHDSCPQFSVLPGKIATQRRTLETFGCGGRLRIEAVLDKEIGAKYLDTIVTVAGWSKSVRKQGNKLVFIALGDGSSVKTLQVVVDLAVLGESEKANLLQCGVSTCFRIRGALVKSPKEEQDFEVQVNKPEHEVKIVGKCDASEFPLAKKSHSREFLREIQHLRPRTNIIGCVTRIRSSLIGATHNFFQSRGFLNIHTPIITAADCEGAGELFQVTTLIPESGVVGKIPSKKVAGEVDMQVVDYSKDFFGKKAFLTVSGQLAVETFATAFCDVYTFGPTFRAEMSHTSRHLAEFWMIEPEIAFADLEDNMKCAESYLRYVLQYVLDNHSSDLEWLEANVEEGLRDRLKNIAESQFARVTYTEAVELLLKCPAGFFEVTPSWGGDLGSEHERYLAEQVYKKPVIVSNYPEEIKAFYMKSNGDKTVAAMDILVPKIGEVVGGSQREDDLGALETRIAAKNLDPEAYWWYRDLRRYGTVPHSGFGVGFERLLMLTTGVENIRDVIPFPRYPGNAEF